jgi:hydroxymethylglutaryl-CoA reductase
MGANIVNTMVEAIGKVLENEFATNIKIKIISNLAIYRIAKCQATFDVDLLGGPSIIENILDACALANIDPFRAATHNKGIMNGISALVIATGNDTRAIEAGAHAYAAINGSYRALSHFELNEHGDLNGTIEIPMALGVIGGLTRSHPQVRLCLKILNVQSANELSQIASAVGLAQNLAALRALASEGIQKGHMKLHARKQQ